MPRFDRFVAVDWSGAAGERHAGIAVASCARGGEAPGLIRADHRWSRGEVLDWVRAAAATGERVLIGFDFCFGLPFADAGAYFPCAADSPADAAALWAEVDAASTADGDLAAHGAVARRRDHFWLGAADGPKAARARLRAVEHHWETRRQGAASSVFALVGAAQCGKASLAGMRLLHRADIPVWPFAPVPPAGPLLVEIYCRTFVADAAARIGGERIGKVVARDRLDRLLAALGSAPSDPRAIPATFSDHAGDALVSAAGMRRAAAEAATWAPPGLDAVRATEGWTFGIA